MVNPYVTTLSALGCLLLGGCAGPGKTDDMAGADVHAPKHGAGGVGPIEVREQHFPDDTVSVRTEGFVDAEGNFVPHGVTTRFWENGRKKSEMRYVQGMRHGRRTAWYQSGQIWSEGQFVNGREDGTWTVWYPNGRKAKELHFDHGAWHGTETEWYLSGQKKMQIEWVRGKRQGPMTVWDESGNVKNRIDYVDGVPQP